VDISRGLQDRINLTFENVLDQIDKFVTKLAYDETAVTKQGEVALRDGQLGSMVACNKNPNDIFRELSLTQAKGDLLKIPSFFEREGAHGSSLSIFYAVYIHLNIVFLWTFFLSTSP
jgi:hypothetical protein